MNSSKKNIINTIDTLLEKHKNDKFFINNLKEYIKNSEKFIENTKQIHNIRKHRKYELQLEKEKFIKYFLNNNELQYIVDSDLFIYYDKFNYVQLDENKVWSNIYSEVFKNKILIPWKQKIRIEIISKIKKNGINNEIITESYTIQKILEILQTICCTTKDSSKYLLTIIGDSILKKQNDKIILINSEFMLFLQELQRRICKYIRCNFINNFKVKYYNHNYETTNILNNNNNVSKEYLWNNLINDNIFNIIFVSLHYSHRYNDSNNFIENLCYCDNTKENILFLRNNSKEQIINNFREKYLTIIESKENNALKVSKNETIYLFNCYLNENNLPKVMFNNDLINILSKIYEYDKERNIFTNITSDKLRYIKNFIDFFDNNFKINSDVTKTKLNNFEISEIMQLYNHNTNHSISERKIIDIINFFYKDIKIIKNKYIYNIFSQLWNKENDISDFCYYCSLNNIKIEYNHYNKWCIINNKKYIVSKNYFNNFIKLKT